MFNKNIFTQKDPIAEAIAKIAEADYKAKMEELKGQQHKIDKNKNNKIDSQDFAILRGQKKAVKEEEQVEEGWDDMLKAAKERSGPQPSGGSGVKKGRAYGGAAQKSKPEHDDADDKKKVKEDVEQVDEASYSAKAAAAGKDIGKPGKMFGVIAKKAAARYGSMVKGKKVAGALLAKLRKEETDYEPLLIDQIMEDTFVAIEQLDEESKNEILMFVEEQLDEVSKVTLQSYMSKNKAHQDKLSKDFYAGDRSKERAHKMAQRGKGYLNAGVKLQKKAHDEYNAEKEKSGANIGPKKKPETPEQRYKRENPNSARPYWGEDVEQVDERTLTKGETAEKERIVKGMKKNLSGFKARYGEKAKSVMYATATKAAKKD